MVLQQQSVQAGHQVLWLHNGQTLRAKVIKASLTQVKLRLAGSGGAEYWVSRAFIRALGQSEAASTAGHSRERGR